MLATCRTGMVVQSCSVTSEGEMAYVILDETRFYITTKETWTADDLLWILGRVSELLITTLHETSCDVTTPQSASP